MPRALGLLGALALWGCAETNIEYPPFPCGDAEEFALVSPILERRCGTLDCHGQIARPLRIYGFAGLRYTEGVDDPVDAGLFPGFGGEPTTDAEREQSRRSVCGLEPAATRAVLEGEARARDLQILRKPSGVESHKGSQVLNIGDEAYTCIEGWLDPSVDFDVDGVCEEAVQIP